MNISKSITWALFGRITSLIIGFLNAVILTRILTQDDFGLYVFIVSVIGFASLLGTVGAPQASVGLISKYLALDNNNNVSAIALLSKRAVIKGITITSLFAAMFFIIWDYVNERMSITLLSLLFIVLWSALYSFQYYIGELFRGFTDIKKATIFGGLQTTTTCLLIFSSAYLFDIKLNIIFVVVSFLFSTLLTCIIGSTILIKHLGSTSNVNISSNIQDEFHTNKNNLWSTSTWGNFADQAPILIGGFIFSTEDLSLLGAALRLAVLLTFGPMVIEAFINPWISNFTSKGENSIASELSQGSAFYSGSLAILVGGVFLIFGDRVLTIVYGDLYADAAILLVLISIARITHALSGPASSALAMSGQHGTLKKIIRFSAISQLCVCLFSSYLDNIGSMVLLICFIVIFEKIILAIASNRLARVNTFASFSSAITLLKITR
jgi:O-antigen/teichoic acid export membrane protein